MGLINVFESIPWGAIGGVGAVAIVLLLLIQVTPIKWDPFGKFFKMAGRNLNQGMMESMNERLKSIDERLENVEVRIEEGFQETKRVDEKLDFRMAFTRRAHILRFSDEVMHEEKHSQEMFNQILDDIKQYDCYCKNHPEFENNRTVLASERIRDVYSKCLRENDFL